MTASISQMVASVVAVACMLSEVRADETSAAPITCLAISRNGEHVVDGSQLGIRVRQWDGLQIRRELPPAFDQLHDLKLSADESMLVVAGGNPAQHAVVAAYTWPDLTLVWNQEFANDVVYSVAFDTTGRRLAVGAHDHNVYLLDASSGKMLGTLSGHSKPVTGVAFLPGSSVLMSCSGDQTIRVRDAVAGTIIRSLNNHTGAVNQIALPNDRNGSLPMVATVSDDRTVRLWQPTIGRMVRFKRLPSAVTAAAWTTDDTGVIVGTKDGCLTLVDVHSLGAKDLFASPDGWINGISVHPTARVVVIGTSGGSLRKVAFGE